MTRPIALILIAAPVLAQAAQIDCGERGIVSFTYQLKKPNWIPNRRFSLVDMQLAKWLKPRL